MERFVPAAVATGRGFHKIFEVLFFDDDGSETVQTSLSLNSSSSKQQS